MPNLYIISGCNGAGKTTASLTVLPETLQCKEFVNCDEIAKGLSPLNPDGAKVAAGRLMLSRIKTLIADKADFAIETTLAAKSYHALIKKAREEGYKASLVYFWLQSPDLAIKRVAERVKHGGHHVDDSIIRRRYKAGIKNLFHLYCPVVDYFLFIDNSVMPSEIIAEGNIKSTKFYNEEKFKKIRQYDNSNSECQEVTKKLMSGLDLSMQRLIAMRCRHNGSFYLCDADGNIYTVKAKEVKAMMEQE